MMEQKKNITKKFKCISIHASNICDLKCPFCYKEKGDIKPNESLFLRLPKYIKEITNQVALGGGEITLFPEFVKKFGKECKKKNLILNITSNGRPLMEMNDEDLKELLQDITMISLSHDNYKIKTKKDFKNYSRLVKRIKKITKTQVGCNLLIDKNLLSQNGLKFKKLVDDLFEMGINRVFALCPKNMKCPDILKVKLIYQFLSIKYKYFFVDDCTKMIITEDKYSDWKETCHRGGGLISIDESGGVSTCSFTEPFTYIKKPQDILKIKIPKDETNCHNCPFLIR